MTQEWIKAVDVELKLDLSMLVKLLRQQNVAHRISEEQGRQVIWVLDRDAIAPVQDVIDGLVAGTIKIEQQSSGQPSVPRGNPILSSLMSFSATASLLVLSIIGFLVVELRWYQGFNGLIFLQPQGNQLLTLGETMSNGQLWRLFTPAFLHFGIFHIVFNSLWLWDLGRRLEVLMGGRIYLLSVIFMAVIANLGQYLLTGGASFGGMSGVIYGFVGYICVRQRFAPHPLLNVPRGVIIFMLFWLVVCMTGVLEQLFSIGVANGAHLGGLFAGLLLGVVASAWQKKLDPQP